MASFAARGEADPQRLLGVHHPAGEDQVLGPRRADQPGQPLGAARAGDEAELDLGLAELGVVGDDPPVAGQRQLAAAAERVPGDGRDHRLRNLRDAVERRGQGARPHRHLLVRGGGELLDVRARGEHLRAAVDDHGPDRRVFGRRVRGLPQFLLDLGVERVHRGPLESDGADSVTRLQPYELAHRAPPEDWFRPAYDG
jgi:hypothetical protein